MNRMLGWLFVPFNRVFGRAADRYRNVTRRIVGRSAVAVVVYGGLVALGVLGFSRVPAGFVPSQDKQYLVAIAQLPDAASLDRTEAVVRRMADIALSTPGVANAVQFPGLSVNGFANKPNAAVIFIGLKPFEERTSKEASLGAIVASLNQKFSAIQEAYVGVFPPPAVNGLGAIGGFKMMLQDRAGVGDSVLYLSLIHIS